jgi:HK97 family phage major capsid protein
MKFTYKTAEEIGKMSAEEQEKYLADKRAFEKQERENEIKEATKGIEETQSKLDESVKGLAQEIGVLNEKLKGSSTNEAKSLSQEIAEKKEELKAVLKGSNKEVEFKALTTRASITNGHNGIVLNDIGQLAHRKLTLYDLFPKFTVADGNNAGVIKYTDWDADTTVRGAAAVAEGAAFPESTAKFVGYTLPLQKIGDSLPVTEEFFEDEQLAASELDMFLQTNVAIKIDTDLYSGNGTAPNLKGILSSVDAYTPVASGLTDANIYDLVVKVSESITSVGGSKFAPDFAIMNIADINKMKLKKDANNNYIIPPFVSRDGKNVDGIVVIEANVVTPNTMVIGDRRYARIYEKAGMTVQQGMVNNQFLEDEVSLKVRKRLAFLIRNADKGGFRKVTSISAALTTLATAP